MIKLKWNDPKTNPNVPKGQGIDFWLAVKSGNKEYVLIAKYQNRPPKFTGLD